MAYKLSFKFDRNKYTGNVESANKKINQQLINVTNAQGIELLRVFQPSRDSIKALFPDEKNLNKTLKKSTVLKAAGFEPRLSMALKAARTVYCYNLDDTLLNTYTQQDIKEHLTQAEWKVKNIFIMNSKKTFKIEMETTEEARKFINSKRTAIGHIPIRQESKEVEVDPTIPQCWECGRLNPQHTSNLCPENKRCIKCGSRSHQFFRCPMPKDVERMTEQDKDNRHCIPCQTRGDHTSLDHKYCPEKRRLVQEKIKAARDKRKAEETEDKRDTNLIQKTLEIANTNAWPALHNSQEQQLKTSTVVLLALVDEAHIPGTFQRKLTNELKKNGLPEVKYEPEPGTATFMAKLLAASLAASNCTDTLTHPHRANKPTGTTSAPSAPNRTIFRAPSISDLGATSLGNQFIITSNTSNQIKRNRTQNNSLSLNDSASLQITAKKSKDDHQSELVHLPKTSTQNFEENDLSPEKINKFNSFKRKIESTSMQVSDKLKHLIPTGLSTTTQHYTILEFRKHILNNDIILSGEAKNELLHESECLCKYSYGNFELSIVLSHSGPRIVSRMSSESEANDFLA